MGLGRGPPDVPFASSYKASEIAALWKALKSCYGSDEAARQAVAQNNQVLCPVYATPSLLMQSRDSLVALLGKREALEVMLKNPMVLTCGSEGLANADPDEIRSTARTRQLLDKYVTPLNLVLLVFALGLLKILGLIASKYGT
eukprot:CAMPEP_0119306528 /NCGR_PEP_ID=MMETSP1333-20130426/7264_1 /TAXON_ID=418940 /ORGANISM="Scyphosphaera apsteinii, Strain RCC1455" /LENGTH=142 /DNA_ID=CAMNT_0007309845 /DNA_START=247 /DNA_END=675 /DNA_ORIENTATION=-